MDITDFKKYAIPKIESGKIVSAVRNIIKEFKNKEQDQYEEQKELYKPIVEKLEQEIDEISDLRENMLLLKFSFGGKTPSFTQSSSCPRALKARTIARYLSFAIFFSSHQVSLFARISFSTIRRQVSFGLL